MSSGANYDVEKWSQTVSQWQSQVNNVPVLAREHLAKGKFKPESVASGFKSLTDDPLNIQYAMGFKDRRTSLTFDILRRIPDQLSVIAAILQTRSHQVAAFSVPFRSSKSIGYIIKHKDPSHETTESEMEKIKELESWIYLCGHKKPNPHNKQPRDDFESFLRKFVRDSLRFDAACIEVITDRRGMPYEFMAVDASTVRIAAPKTGFGFDNLQERPPPYSRSSKSNPENQFGPFRSLNLYNKNDFPEDAMYCQVMHGRVVNVYSQDELIYGVRNPRSDIYSHGYGYGELEQLITIITAHLNAEHYNRNFFTSGSSPKGMLVFKGDEMDPHQLEGFQRQWRAQVEGVSNSWATPIMQSEQGVDWIDLHPSNRDMEYGQWVEYLLKITCAVFGIDPAELNFDMHGGVQQTPLFESSQEWKLKASRDKGLKPLLRFISKLINEHIITKIDDRFVFEFVGLDELTEQEKHTLRMEQVGSYLTLNEVRRSDDLPDIENGDIPMNPVYLQAQQVQIQKEQQEGQQQQQQGGGGAEPLVDQTAEPGRGASPEGTPQYADTFNKSLDKNKYLEIQLSLDEWMDSVRV